MSVQVTASHRSPFNVLKKINSRSSGPSTQCISPPDLLFLLRKNPLELTAGRPVYRRRTITPKTYLRLPFGASPSYQRCSPVCSFGGKGNPESGDESSTWKSLEKAMGSLKKEQSVEDALRQQIEKQEYYDDGGSDGNGLGGGDGGGKGRGRGSSPGGSGDAGFFDELLQTTLALFGIILLYVCFIRGDNYLFLLARDYIKSLLGWKRSNRVQLSKIWWMRLLRKWMPKQISAPYHLESDIVNTPTYWDDVTNKYYGFYLNNFDEIDRLEASRKYGLPSYEEESDDWYSSSEEGDSDEEDEYLEPENDDDDDDDDDDEPSLDSGETEEPHLASKEENEPDLTSDTESSGNEESVLASGENGVPNLDMTESDKKDEDHSDSTDSDDDYLYFPSKFKVTKADVDFATRMVDDYENVERPARHLRTTKKVMRRVVVSRACEEEDEEEH